MNLTQEKVSFSNARGNKLSGVLHHPGQEAGSGAVILCHGMDSTKESKKLVFLGEALALRGFTALRFDFAYVGESDGKFEDITYTGEVEDLKAAYALIQNRGAGKIAIIGSSMGGSVALLFAALEPKVAVLVTVAAPIHPEQFPRRILTPEQMQEWRESGFTIYNGQRLNVSLLDDLEKLNIPESARKIICPVLILHGDRDNIVPVREAHELHGYLPNPKKLTILKGVDHRLSDPALMTQAVSEAIEWICQHMS